MFKYTKAAIDIVINDIKRYCNIFKYGSMFFTILYFCHSLYSKSGNFIANIVLLSLFSFYTILELFTYNKELNSLKRFIKKSYKSLKMITKTFSLGVVIYGIYIASTNVSAISIILATLMIIVWVLQLLFEVIIGIFEAKKDLIVVGWNKDIENLKKPVTTVNNFIKKVKGEEIKEEVVQQKEIMVLEKQINKSKKEKTLIG